MRQLVVLALCTLICACANTGPVDPNRGNLIATEGVRQVFEDDTVDVAEATDRIKCRHVYRVGTHLIQRLCVTTDEETADEDRHRRYNLKYLDQITRAKSVEPQTGRPVTIGSSNPD